METTATSVVTVFGAALILILQPRHALGVFIACLVGYPVFLTLQMGPLSFSATRILIPILLVKVWFASDLFSRFRWQALDTWVLIYAIAQVVALLTNVPAEIALQRQSGLALDTVFPYFAVRLIVRSRRDFWSVVQAFIYVSIPVAMIGVIQSVTWSNPYGYIHGFFAVPNPVNLTRHGLYRADASFGNYIAFGMHFAFMAPLVMALYGQRIWKNWIVLGCFAVMTAGALASLSSGPMFTIFMGLAMVAGFPLRDRWRMFVVLGVLFCIFLEFYSNRHFYEVITRFAFNSHTAYYRIGLYEEALGGGMRGHWLFGYGYVGIGPGNDNTNFHWVHLDMTSIYIGALARFGLAGLIPLLAIKFLVYRRLYLAAQRFERQRDQWLIWTVAAALAGWSIGTLSVNLVQQTLHLFYIQIALAWNLPLVLAGMRRPRAAGPGGPVGDRGGERLPTRRPDRPPGRPDRRPPQPGPRWASRRRPPGRAGF